MTREVIEIIILGGWVLINRIWSHYEHRKGREDIREIKIYMNGELQRKLEQARDSAVEEYKEKNKRTNNRKKKKQD